jgi:large subunit ribosomal protein L7A
MDEALRKPSARVVGAKQTLKKLKAGQVTAVYVAKDAEPAVVGEVVRLAETLNVPVHYADDMAELGRACGIQVGAACAGKLAP